MIFNPRPSHWMLIAALMLPSSTGFHLRGDEGMLILDHLISNGDNDELRRGHGYYRKGDYKSATKAYYGNTKKNPKDGSSWYYLGLSYLKLNQFNYATQVLNTAVEISPREEVQYHLALALHQNGEVQQAVQCLRALLQQHEKNDLAWTLLGRSYESLGQFAQAKTCYNKALAIAPHQGQALFFLERLDSKLPLGSLQLGSGSQKSAPALAESPLAPANGEATMAPSATQSVPQGLIPRSRMLSRLEKAQESSDLIPLLQCYHLSADAPEKGLAPTKVMEWEKASPASGSKDEGKTAEPAIPAPEGDAIELEKSVPQLSLPMEDL